MCDELNMTGLTYPLDVSPTGRISYLDNVTLICTEYLPKPVVKQRQCIYDSVTRSYMIQKKDIDCPGKLSMKY